jgi:putative transposase
MVRTYGGYDYRFITSMMRNAGCRQATSARVACNWREEDLKMLQKQTPGMLWFNDGSCIRLMPIIIS